MERKVSYPTKIAGGILIALLTFALLAQLLLVFLIVTFGKDWFFATAEYGTSNQAYAGIIALILGTLIVGFIIGISIITGLSLVFNTIFYLRCLRGKISIFAMVTNLVLISIAFILIAPSYTGLSPSNIVNFIIVMTFNLIMFVTLIYSVLALIDSKKKITLKSS